MKAAHAFALAFLFGLLIEPLGLALLARTASPPSAVPTNNKAPECPVRLPTSFEATGNQLKATPVDSVQEGVQVEAQTRLQARAWTVLIYLDGDNDLEEAAFEDFNSMELVGSTLDAAILVYVDFKSTTSGHGAGAECYYISKDANMNKINSTALPTSLPTEPNMGDSNTLLQFITFGQSYMPADHYLLVLWDHGSGFYGVCLDETSGNDRLLPAEISDVLSNGAVQRIDLVAFDACLMGQLEIAYELRNDTDLIVFSEESIPESGFPYEKFLKDLADHWYWTGAELATSMVNRYNEAYAGGIYYNPSNPDTQICLSAVNGSRVVEVAGALDFLIHALLTPAALRNNYESICAARGATQSFSWPDFMDLGDFALQLRPALLSAALSNSALILQKAAAAAVYREQHLTGLPGATGLGLAFSTHHSIPLELITDTSYEDFMRAFEGIGNTSATAFSLSGLGSHYGYLDGKDDDVYFRFTPSAPDVLTFRLDTLQMYDEDFDLYLYDSNLNELRASEGYTSTEFIEYNCVYGEVYYIRVHSYADPEIVDGLGAFRLTILPASWIDPVVLGILVIAIIVIVLLVVCAVAAARQGWLRRWETGPTYTRRSPSASAAFPALPPGTGRAGFCSNCGATLPAAAQRCPSCGHEQD
jgi:hypothetical protein